MKTINQKDNRVQKLESRKLELETEISKLYNELSAISGKTTEVYQNYVSAAAVNVAGIDTDVATVAKCKAALDKNQTNADRIGTISLEIDIKQTAVKEINRLLYKEIPSEEYAQKVSGFIEDAEKVIEKFRNSKQVNAEIIKEIMTLDLYGYELNSYADKIWKIYIPSDFGYMYLSVSSRFRQNVKINFEELQSTDGFKAKISEEYVRFFESAINHCKVNYRNYIFNRFDDNDLCNYLINNSNLSTEQREYLSYWRADIFSM